MAIQLPPERYKEVPIFERLEVDEVGHLLLLADEKTFKPGERIFSQGDPADSFYILLEGKVEVRRREEGGKEVPVVVLEPSTAFGESSLVPGGVRNCATYALEETRCGQFMREDFERLLADWNLAAYKVAYNFMRIMTDRLQKLDSLLVRLVSKVQESDPSILEELSKTGRWAL